MSIEKTAATEKQLNLIVELLNQPAGFAVSADDRLFIVRGADGFYVWFEEEDYEPFKDPFDAARRFLALRAQHKLGRDNDVPANIQAEFCHPGC